MSRIRTAWHRALEATHLPIAGYLIFVGFYSLFADDGAVMSQFPSWLSYGWSVSLVLGGILVVGGTISGQTRTESAGHGFHLFGIGLYTVAYMALLGWDGVMVIATLSLVSLIRMRVLRRARVAQYEAGRIVGGDEGR